MIRQLRETDRAAWQALWRGYQEFYEADLRDGEDALFARLLKPGPDGPFALVAEGADGRLTGLVQFLYHGTTWSEAQRCYLNDLYTVPEARGQGVGRKLIEAVYAHADARGAGQVYWLTQEFNHTARKLYDSIAKVTPFIKYSR